LKDTFDTPISSHRIRPIGSENKIFKGFKKANFRPKIEIVKHPSLDRNKMETLSNGTHKASAFVEPFRGIKYIDLQTGIMLKLLGTSYVKSSKKYDTSTKFQCFFFPVKKKILP